MPSRRWSSTLVLACCCLALAGGGKPRALPASAPTPDLLRELEVLRPFLGSWIGHFDDPEATMDVFATWTEILGGQAVRGVRTVPDVGGFEVEVLYYFDREMGAVSYLSVTNNGYVTRGQVTFDGGRFVTEGRQVFPDSTVRSTQGTWTFGDDGTLVNEGGHRIIFERR